jgi:hypothetical protein
MRDAVRVIFLVEGGGRLEPLEPRWGSEGVGGVHLLGDAGLPAGLIHLGAPKDHEATLGLRALVVFLLGAVRWVIGLQGRLLGLALLAEGATDVALCGSIVLEEVPSLPPCGTSRGTQAPSQSVLGVHCARRAEVWQRGQPRPPSPPHGAFGPYFACRGIAGTTHDHRYHRHR